MRQTSPRIASDQSGMASIIITMVMMIVITLLVLGFANIANREQRNALDDQLSAQAFYAAESGVNDAIANLSSYPNGKNTCAPDARLTGVVNSGKNVAYTCVLINPAPGQLTGELSNGQSQVFLVQAASGTIDHITIGWKTDGTLPSGSTCNGSSLPQGTTAGWGCPTALLQVDEVPGNATSENILSSATTTYLYPSPEISAFKNGGITETGCASGSRQCSYTLTIGAGADIPSSSTYYLKVMPLYVGTTQVTVTAYDVNGHALPLVNDEVEIDSTGKAQDELRRIQEDVPVRSQYFIPAGALQSASSICKQFEIIPPGSPGSPGGNGPNPGSDAQTNPDGNGRTDCNQYGY